MAVRRAATRLARQLRRAAGEGALASGALSVLGELHRHGEQTPRRLAAVERVQPQSLSRTLARLESDGLVRRRVDTTDRRRSWIGITPAGRRALASEMAERDEWLAAQLESLTPAERAVLAVAAEVMERLAEAG